MIRRPPRSTLDRSSAASDVYKRQDDYTPGDPNPVTQDLINVLSFNAGVTANDKDFQSCFPFVAEPWESFRGESYTGTVLKTKKLGLSTPKVMMSAYPSPFNAELNVKYKLAQSGTVKINLVDITGRIVQTISEGVKSPGEYTSRFKQNKLPAGTYFANIQLNDKMIQSVKVTKIDK